MRPVPPVERIPLIDALRGVALIGIIVANMRGFNSPLDAYMRPHLMWDAPVDRVISFLIDCFVGGKFITIFGILFGVGFAIQFERASSRAEEFTAIYIRRMLLLLLFGAAHVFVFWWGDILATYAVMGLCLLFYRNIPRDTLMLWAMMLYWFPVLLFIGFLVLSLSGGTGVPVVPQATNDSIRESIRIYTEGSWPEMLRLRLGEWQIFNSSAPYFLPRILSYFLFGIWLWKKKVLQNPARYLPTIRRALPWLALIGLAGNFAFVWINQIVGVNPMEPGAATVVMWLSSSAGIPVLSLFYIGLVILLHHSERGKRWLQPFACVGRMALTNYLMQSAICTAIFYGFGLGLYGRTPPLPGLLLAVAIYGLQVILSALWLRHYRYGPIEWLWRTLTYGRL